MKELKYLISLILESKAALESYLNTHFQMESSNPLQIELTLLGNAYARLNLLSSVFSLFADHHPIQQPENANLQQSDHEMEIKQKQNQITMEELKSLIALILKAKDGLESYLMVSTGNQLDSSDALQIELSMLRDAYARFHLVSSVFSLFADHHPVQHEQQNANQRQMVIDKGHKALIDSENRTEKKMEDDAISGVSIAIDNANNEKDEIKHLESKFAESVLENGKIGSEIVELKEEIVKLRRGIELSQEIRDEDFKKKLTFKNDSRRFEHGMEYDNDEEYGDDDDEYSGEEVYGDDDDEYGGEEVYVGEDEYVREGEYVRVKEFVREEEYGGEEEEEYGGVEEYGGEEEEEYGGVEEYGGEEEEEEEYGGVEEEYDDKENY